MHIITDISCIYMYVPVSHLRSLVYLTKETTTTTMAMYSALWPANRRHDINFVITTSSIFDTIY